MRPDIKTAIKLRKAGKSYNEISRVLKISKSTLSLWFRDYKWSDKVKISLQKLAREGARLRMKKMGLKNKKERMRMYSQMRKEASRSYKIFRKYPLFLEGLMIYWGEGDNKLENGQIRVANSNPLLIKNFHLFLKRYLSYLEPKIKMYLVLYPDLSDYECKNYWSKIVGLPLDRFFKSQYIKGRSTKRTLPFGIGTIIITSRRHKEIIMRWLELRKKEIQLARV
ncbi:MAG: Uncharacterized protein G01um101413_672 [Parcubacteria group bacterium Gr01-1014_13]|nr:MAG: Uncharacterized protein G01um101413_672 [Parcubacteria group bacterium Gr01-1014_13]